MSETAPAYDRKAIQRARASYLRDVLLEPWSLRPKTANGPRPV